MELSEYIIDLDIGVRTGGGARRLEPYHGGGQVPPDPSFHRVSLLVLPQSFFSPLLNNHWIFHLLPPVGFFPNTIRERTHP